MIVAWKVIAQGLAVTGAVGVTAVSMFGADSATKPRPVHVAPPKSAASTTTTAAPPPTDGAALGAGSTSDGGSGGSSGGSGGSSGTGSAGAADAGTGATTGVAPSDATVTTVTTTAGVPPPTVDESGLPIALPLSAVVVVGATAGGIGLSRRRGRTRGRDR